MTGDYYIDPATQSTPVNTPTGTYTISNNGINVTPGQVHTFLLSDGGAGGTFLPSASITGGVFTYQNAMNGTYTLTATPTGGDFAPFGSRTAQAVVGTGMGGAGGSGGSGGGGSGGSGGTGNGSVSQAVVLAAVVDERGLRAVVDTGGIVPTGSVGGYGGSGSSV